MTAPSTRSSATDASPPRRQIAQQAPHEGGIIGSDSSAVPCAPFQLACLHRGETLRTPRSHQRHRARSRPRRAERRTACSSPGATSCAVEPERLHAETRGSRTGARRFGEHQAARCRAPKAPSASPGGSDIRASSDFRLDDVRQRARPFDRVEETPASPRRQRRDRPPDSRGRHSCKATPPAPPASSGATLRNCSAQTPTSLRGPLSCVPGQQHHEFWRSRYHWPPATRPGS